MTDAPLPRNAQLFRGLSAPLDDYLPPPPYQVSDVYMNFVGVRFDRDAVRKLLPPQLVPVEGHTGTICVYSAGFGWGIAPYSACFAAIEVVGYDLPDGSAAFYMAAGYFSGRAGIVMSRDYNRNFEIGGSRHFYDQGEAIGIGGPDGLDALTIRTRPSGQRPPITAGIHHYLGKNGAGGTNLYAVAYTGELWDAQPISIDVAALASERLRLARPIELIWAFDCRNAALTFSPPRPISDPRDALAVELTKASLLSAFSRIGRAAVLVGQDGEISVMNSDAEALMGDGVRVLNGRLTATRPQDQSALIDAIVAATKQETNQFNLDPIAIERSDGRTLIVQPMPIDIDVMGRPSALLLLNDPASAPSASPLPALQLLGLTPAEARIAELVGSGLSPREAAEKLDNSEGTVRTSLTRIYQKLDINRQSELARIVARL